MSFVLYRLWWYPSDQKNEGHVAFCVETAEEKIPRTVNGKRVSEKVQTGLMFHATDRTKKIVKDGDVQFLQFEFEKRPDTPVKSVTLAKMFAIGKLEIARFGALATIAESVPQPRRPFPYTGSNKRPNCATWYEDFIQKLSDGNVVTFSEKEESVDRFQPRKVASGLVSGSSSASGHKKKLRDLFRRG